MLTLNAIFARERLLCDAPMSRSGGKKGEPKEWKGGEENDRYRIKRRLVERLRFVFVFFVSSSRNVLLFIFIPGKMLFKYSSLLLMDWTFRLNSVLSLFANLSENIYRFALSYCARSPGRVEVKFAVYSWKATTCFMGILCARICSRTFWRVCY